MNLTVDDGRRFLQEHNLDVAVIVAYDPKSESLQFITVGADLEKADMAARLGECIQTALCVDPEKLELVEDRRNEHLKPGEEE